MQAFDIEASVCGGRVTRGEGLIWTRFITSCCELHEWLLSNPRHRDLVARRSVLRQEHPRVVSQNGAALLPPGGRVAGNVESLRIHQGLLG